MTSLVLWGRKICECSSSLVRVRARHNIVRKKFAGEAAGVPEGVTEEWLSHKWPALCEGYKPKKIFNVDETGLFYNLTPDKTIKFNSKPMDQGVIKALKSRYRKLQVLQMLQNIENGKDTKSLSILDAILISEAWENVKQPTIANCFRHAGFKDLSPSRAVNDYDIPLANMIQSPTDEDNNVPLAQLRRSTATEPRIELEEFIGIDDDVAVCASATEEEIFAEAESNNSTTDEKNDQQDHQEQFQPTTIYEALNAITVLQKFVTFNEQFNTDDTLMTMKRKIQNIFETRLTKYSLK